MNCQTRCRRDCAARQSAAKSWHGEHTKKEAHAFRSRGMKGSAKLFLASGCLAALLAVALGAFGAHGLKARLAPELLAVYQTGVQYHFYHALGLILVGLTALHRLASP